MKHGLQSFRELGCRCDVCLAAMLHFMRSGHSSNVNGEADSWTREEIIRSNQRK
tara:strand:+ start:498 stop:659 length:162 start_codon:yes stop_codon:yes gene_type:complete